jgi:hypothetical protein
MNSVVHMATDLLLRHTVTITWQQTQAAFWFDHSDRKQATLAWLCHLGW